ncbi:C2 domain containing protein [Trichomonas vaginalis G3]|uniref:C2 domain containing protein n=1 Tax=Trichomonas vaginalis (strain ATCC PRA-98 / G3) TaxID=412133 RepID=A2DBY3_TRIV3|nr:intracellular sterol transport [Trichomonas vaginalis G3]EAY22024.1 C2 domain containing protein [Trichomonas vaginalis G3]KAI5525351.1 intracellular sterol transport [Trichomonas vaginalis G3]|eukprot:XP_001583010.1 C2 domain containing protein [Trichomonas vaginalis G3]
MNLNLRAIEAKDMPKEDLFGKCDPFIEIFIDSKQVEKTKVIKKTYNPKWDETFYIPLYHSGSTIEFRFSDYDTMSSNDKFGYITFNLDTIPIGKVIDEWYPLTPYKKNKKVGEAHFVIQIAPEKHTPFTPYDGPAEWTRQPPAQFPSPYVPQGGATVPCPPSAGMSLFPADAKPGELICSVTTLGQPKFLRGEEAMQHLRNISGGNPAMLEMLVRTYTVPANYGQGTALPQANPQVPYNDQAAAVSPQAGISLFPADAKPGEVIVTATSLGKPQFLRGEEALEQLRKMSRGNQAMYDMLVKNFTVPANYVPQ